ncbi:hypothetical protein B0J17DRAFT_674591 [Rhizoctonia solani]|nr:hypothetical protein B0J17DRAFT_674591 [Rhizoctonia solani]
MPSLVAHPHLSSAISAFKAKLRMCKHNIATFRSRTSASCDKRRSIKGERRHVQGLGLIQADIAPRRGRRVAAEAKYGDRATRNQIAQASEITTVGGFAYDRLDADSMEVPNNPRSIPQ